MSNWYDHSVKNESCGAENTRLASMRPNKTNADGMIQSKPWESVIQLCYVANMRLVCDVHADVVQPGMAETDSR